MNIAGIKAGMHVLDLACGQGRHAIELARRGVTVVGSDYSEYLLSVARAAAEEEGVSVTFAQEDMRAISYAEEFDAAINMFSAFAYFNDESDNERVLARIHKALVPGGFLVLDLANPLRVIDWITRNGRTDKDGASIISDKRELEDGTPVLIQESISADQKYWGMRASWHEDGNERSYQTRVRLYRHEELKAMLTAAGFSAIQTYGNFRGEAYKEASRRMIFVAYRATDDCKG